MAGVVPAHNPKLFNSGFPIGFNGTGPRYNKSNAPPTTGTFAGTPNTTHTYGQEPSDCIIQHEYTVDGTGPAKDIQENMFVFLNRGLITRDNKNTHIVYPIRHVNNSNTLATAKFTAEFANRIEAYSMGRTTLPGEGDDSTSSSSDSEDDDDEGELRTARSKEDSSSGSDSEMDSASDGDDINRLPDSLRNMLGIQAASNLTLRKGPYGKHAQAGVRKQTGAERIDGMDRGVLDYLRRPFCTWTTLFDNDSAILRQGHSYRYMHYLCPEGIKTRWNYAGVVCVNPNPDRDESEYNFMVINIVCKGAIECENLWGLEGDPLMQGAFLYFILKRRLLSPVGKIPEIWSDLVWSPYCSVDGMIPMAARRFRNYSHTDEFGFVQPAGIVLDIMGVERDSKKLWSSLGIPVPGEDQSVSRERVMRNHIMLPTLKIAATFRDHLRYGY